jgi:Mor family transcriptional regulator
MRNRLYEIYETVTYSPTQQKVKRNAEIKRRYTNGVSITTLASQFDISVQRVHQIIRDKRN